MQKRKYVRSVFSFLLILTLGPLFSAGSDYRYSAVPETDIYFGHISWVDIKEDGYDPVVIRDGSEIAEPAVLNFPIAPGDRVITSDKRRCEIQFDTGTVIRLDVNTELNVITILAPSLSSRNKITNMEIVRGRIYIMYKRYDRPEIFQVRTSNAAAKISHGTVALLEYDGRDSLLQVVSGKSSVIFGPDERRKKVTGVKREEALRINQDHESLEAAYAPDHTFWLWNEDINRNFKALHEGKTSIPKPIYRYPRAVIEFAEKYSHPHGEWLWDDLFGYVWRPYTNDYYPWGIWRPYFFGQWRLLNEQLFWVPQENWGWVPYHLGVWMWNKKKGWLWIPGDAFAPAWVSWSYFRGFLAWRPWGFMDWYLYGSLGSDMGFYSSYHYLDPAFGSIYGIYPGRIDNPENGRRARPILTSINKSQLKKSIKNSPYPLSKSGKAILYRIAERLKSGDREMLESSREMPRQTTIVPISVMDSPKLQDHALTIDHLSEAQKRMFFEPNQGQAPRTRAAAVYRNIRESAVVPSPSFPEIGEKAFSRADVRSIRSNGEEEKGAGQALPLSAVQSSRLSRAAPVIGPGPPVLPMGRRASFRDWNPDVGIAARAGVSIHYSAGTNQVVCPELNLTSKSVSRFNNMAARTGFTGRSSASFSGSSGTGGNGGSASGTGIGAGSSTRSSGTRSAGTSSRSGTKSKK